MPLNIDWQQILLHLLNFVILFAILYFLLYKPVKQFMDKRTEHYQKLEDDAAARLQSAEEAKAEYLEKLASADEEIKAKKDEARRQAEEAGAAKLRESEAAAEKLLGQARQEAEREREKLLGQARREVSGLVADAAERLAAGSSTSEAFDMFLDAAKGSEADEHG